jgi:hypothetical protein
MSRTYFVFSALQRPYGEAHGPYDQTHDPYAQAHASAALLFGCKRLNQKHLAAPLRIRTSLYMEWFYGLE